LATVESDVISVMADCSSTVHPKEQIVASSSMCLIGRAALCVVRARVLWKNWGPYPMLYC